MKVILFIIILLFIPIVSNAQSDEIQVIDGRYLNQDIGIEFVLPDGWTGTQLQSISTAVLSTDAIIATPGDIRTSEENVFILIIMIDAKNVLDKADIPDPISNMREQDCELLSARFMTIGDIEGIEIVTECSELDNAGITVKNKVILVQEPTRSISIFFISKSDRYNEYIKDFDGMISTINMSDNFVTFTELPNQTINGSVSIKTDSEINELKIDEDDKNISFSIEDDIGIADVYLNNTLKGPYTIVAKPSFLVMNTTEGVKIVYNDIDKMKIIGTEVIPEFPIALPILATVAGIMIIISRRI